MHVYLFLWSWARCMRDLFLSSFIVFIPAFVCALSIFVLEYTSPLAAWRRVPCGRHHICIERDYTVAIAGLVIGLMIILALANAYIWWHRPRATWAWPV